LRIALHGYNEEAIVQSIDEFLVHPVSKVDYRERGLLHHMLTDVNNVTVEWRRDLVFSQTQHVFNNQFFSSDPVVAHHNCVSKTCHMFKNAKLYKCSMVATLPEVNQQLDMNLNTDAIALLENYQPMLAEWTSEQKRKFLLNLKNPIEQCSLCPEKLYAVNYISLNKKDI
jgi:hypothetical protein